MYLHLILLYLLDLPACTSRKFLYYSCLDKVYWQKYINMSRLVANVEGIKSLTLFTDLLVTANKHYYGCSEGLLVLGSSYLFWGTCPAWWGRMGTRSRARWRRRSRWRCGQKTWRLSSFGWSRLTERTDFIQKADSSKLVDPSWRHKLWHYPANPFWTWNRVLKF